MIDQSKQQEKAPEEDGFDDFGDFEQAENKVEIKSNEIGIIGNIGS